jgi:hypothetical protein
MYKVNLIGKTIYVNAYLFGEYTILKRRLGNIVFKVRVTYGIEYPFKHDAIDGKIPTEEMVTKAVLKIIDAKDTVPAQELLTQLEKQFNEQEE